jgi:hypothetical protein
MKRPADDPDSHTYDDENNHRHWSPETDNFACGDALTGVLEDGWKPAHVVFREDCWRGGLRHVSVYHVRLARGDEKVTMHVVQNPGVDRILHDMDVQIVQMNELKLPPRPVKPKDTPAHV